MKELEPPLLGYPVWQARLDRLLKIKKSINPNTPCATRLYWICRALDYRLYRINKIIGGALPIDADIYRY